MSNFDYDEIEQELDLVVPDVFRLFLDTIESNGRDPSEFDLYENTQALIDGNWQMRENWDGWTNHFLAIGVSDGSGNDFFISAKSEDDDEILLMAHDPPGVEPNGSATEFFAAMWKHPDESDPFVRRLLEQGFEDEDV